MSLYSLFTGDFGWLIDRKSADLKKGATTAIAAAIPHRTRKAVWQFVQANYTPVEAEVGASTWTVRVVDLAALCDVRVMDP